MSGLIKFLNNQVEKLYAGVIIAAIWESRVSIIALVIMMVLDTVIGISYALKLKRFSSKKLKRFIEKITTYFAAIIAIRLVEVGISPLIQTSFITKVLSGFLIITESISVLRNLTLLGVPLPSSFISVIIKQIKAEPLEVLLKDNATSNYIAEITDLIDYQIPTIKSKEMQTILKIKFQEWSHVIVIIDQQLTENSIYNKDLIFYKIVGLFNTTREIINEKVANSDVCAECIKNFNTWHNPRVEIFINGVKDIIYGNEKIEIIKNLVIERIMLILYETIIDIQRGEVKAFKDNCH